MKDKTKDENFSTICLFALRYTFGRMTYSASLVSDFVKKHINKISDNGVQVMIRDIEKEI